MLALVLAACGSPGTADDAFAVALPAAKRGEPIALDGTSIDGARINLSEMRGHVVVLNVWQSTCGPCRKEAADLAAAYNQRAGNGVAFVGLDAGESSKEAAAAFQHRFNIPYPSIWDQAGTSLLALRGAVSPKAVPSTVVLDRTGRIAVRFTGAITAGTLTQAIDGVAAEG